MRKDSRGWPTKRINGRKNLEREELRARKGGEEDIRGQPPSYTASYRVRRKEKIFRNRER